MNFLSISFWAAFCAFFLLYIFIKKWSRTAMLLWVIAFDLFFFWQANGWLMLLLPATAAVNFFLTELLRRRASWILALIVLLDLGTLVFFKYGGAFDSGIILPIGISFYTFQAISYSVDVYRGKYDGRPDFLEFCFYLSFFPLLLAGPITRAGRFLPQIRRAEPATRHELRLGLWLIVCGLLKKGVLADYLAVYNNLAFDSPAAYSGYELLMAALGYTMQIYLDFSGYSDLSIGIASLMGFRLDDNFRFPYRSLNLTEFWRRWHISLSTWFKEYVYIPLGGSRRGRVRTVMNKWLVFLLTGLWHGANFTFLLWGLWHGFWQMLETWQLIPTGKKWFRIPGHLYAMLVVVLGFVLFRADTVGQALAVIGAMFCPAAGAPAANRELLRLLSPAFLLSLGFALLLSAPVFPRLRQLAERGGHAEAFETGASLVSLLLFGLSVLSLVSGGYNPFIYFRF